MRAHEGVVVEERAEARDLDEPPQELHVVPQPLQRRGGGGGGSRPRSRARLPLLPLCCRHVGEDLGQQLQHGKRRPVHICPCPC